MPSHFTETKERLRELIDFLISGKRDITIKIEGNKASYRSRIIKADYGDTLSNVGKGRRLFIERLTPDTGNALLKLSHGLVIQFQLSNNPCQFESKYLGESTNYPDIGLIVSFPQSVGIQERRSYDRNTKKTPEFLHAFLTLPKGAGKVVSFKLKIVNRSADGIGMLVTKKNFHLLKMIKRGDKLQNLELYASKSMVRASGTVRHKTKLEETKYKGFYILGIKLDETLEDLDLS